MARQTKVRLFSSHNRYVYIVARKLHRGERVISSKTGQLLKVRDSDWGFENVYNTMHKAEVGMMQHIEISKEFDEDRTYGIISIEDGELVLLKSARSKNLKCHLDSRLHV